MHRIIKLIRSPLIQLITKNPSIVLRQCTKLIVLILKLEISQANLVDNLFPHLCVDKSPIQSRLFCNFIIIAVLSRAKPLIVLKNYDEFAP